MRQARSEFSQVRGIFLADSIILMGDQRVRDIPVKENKNPVVDFRKQYPSLRFDLKRINVQKQSQSISWGRMEVGLRLIKAEEILQPTGIRLLIKECYRPMAVEKAIWDQYYNYLKTKHPDWTEEQFFEDCVKFNAPLDVAPHTTGGAVAVTLIDKNNEVIDMGTEVNASPIKTELKTYTDARNISKWAKKNRALLGDAMKEAGFVNYPTQWWHWSYGDKYWALQTGAPEALYSSVEIFK